MKKVSIFILSTIVLLLLATILYYQENIIHPQRRALQPYHYKWLNHPKQHSMKILKDEHRRDILIVQRDSTVKLSKRSQKVFDDLGYKEEALSNRGIMLMFHGKNGRKEDLLPVAERYITAGFTCVLVDLPAHGDSSIESMNYQEHLAVDVLNLVKKKIDISSQPIYFWGISLGGRYAINSVEDGIKVKALILLSTFDNFSYILEEKAVNLFGKYIGKILYEGLNFSSQLFYDFEAKKVDSIALAQKIDVPIFMLHGKLDRLISYKHGEKLFQAFPNKDKTFHLDEKGEHHNILNTKYPFYLKSIRFLLEHP